VDRIEKEQEVTQQKLNQHAAPSTGIAYLRVSTEGQATDGVSLEMQRDRIATWCAGQGYVLSQTHLDSGISGKSSANRPGLKAAIAAASEQPGRALIVYSLSRLARSTKDMLEISERLELAGADLVSLTERIDTTSAAGRMVFRMLAVLSEFERDLVAERTRCALAIKKRRGEVVGEVPFGSRREGNLLVPDPIEWKLGKRIAAMRAQGLSLRAIATKLTDQGDSTAKGSKVWHANTVQRILKQAAA